jgi:outer membrane protein assembly complex protein YaeT
MSRRASAPARLPARGAPGAIGRRVAAAALVCLFASGCAEPVTGAAVGAIRLVGVAAFDDDQVKAILATRESAKAPWSKPHPFDEEVLQEDLKRIAAFYVDRGYPNARVTSHKTEFNEKKDRVDIAIEIDEGPAVVLERVRFFGFDVLPPGVFERLREAVARTVGRPRDQAQVREGRERAAQTLHDHGYPFAVVEALEAPGAAPHTADITFAADPGAPAVFGPVDVRGVLTVSADIVRRQLTFQPGETFRARLLLESQRRLYAMDLFTFVNVDAPREGALSPGAGDQPVALPVRVSVVEGKHRRIRLRGGYGSEELVRGEIRWSHVNFFGGARTGSVEGKWSALDRGVRLGFTEPYFFRPKYSFSASLQSWYTDEPAYRLETRGGRATVTRDAATRDAAAGDAATTTLSGTLINEYEWYEISNEALLDPTFRDELIALGLDPRTGFGEGRVAALAADLQRSTVANLIDSRDGYVASLHLERAGLVLGGDFDYFEARGEGRYYVTVARKAVAPGPPGQEAVPFFKRYFLGGSTSMRGWGRFEVAPLSAAGFTIGGLSFLEATAEARLPIAGDVSGVLFVDAGNAWLKPWDIRLGDLRANLGAGVRYATPIGPLRLDYGYQLTPIPGLLVDGVPEERRWRVHFSLGHAF